MQSVSDSLAALLKRPYQFTARPSPVDPEFRLSWRIPLLVASLAEGSRNQTSSVSRLHVLHRAVRSQEVASDLIARAAHEPARGVVVIGIDDALEKVIDFATGLRVVEKLKGGRVRLTGAGAKIAAQIMDNDLLARERLLLTECRRVVSEDAVKRLRTTGRLFA